MSGTVLFVLVLFVPGLVAMTIGVLSLCGANAAKLINVGKANAVYRQH